MFSAPAGAGPVQPPSQLRMVLVSASVYVDVAGKPAGQLITAGGQVAIVVVLVITTVDTLVVVICPVPGSVRGAEADELSAVPVLVMAGVVTTGVAAAAPEIGLYGRNENRL